jgi:hypothetical protein
MSGRSWERETDGRTIWKRGCPVPISSSIDRFYLTHHVGSESEEAGV